MMSDMFFPRLPLTFFFCFCLFFSFSHAHYKNHETPTCDCATAHNNSHENIPTKPGNSSPGHDNSHANIPTKPGNSSPGHDSHENIPTKPGNSSPGHDSHENIPTKPGNSSPGHNSHDNIPTKPGKSSPGHNSHDNIPTKPGNSSPAHNSSHEIPTKPGNSSPPIGCLPLHISLCPLKAALDHMGCAASVNTAVMVHNQILQRRLEKFRRLYPNCHILYADYWNAYLTILMNLKKYQFEEAFKPCCGATGGPLNFNVHSLCGSPGTNTCNDPSKFISWDGIHLTEAMNRKVTDLFLNQGFCQPSFSELVKSKSGM